MSTDRTELAEWLRIMANDLEHGCNAPTCRWSKTTNKRGLVEGYEDLDRCSCRDDHMRARLQVARDAVLLGLEPQREA